MTRASGHASWKEALDFAERRTEVCPGHPQNCLDCTAAVREAQECVRSLRFLASLRPHDRGWADRAWDQIVALAGSPTWSSLRSEIQWAEDEAGRLSGDSGAGPGIGQHVVDAARGAFQAVRATLLADSWTDMAGAVRGNSLAAPRVLVYETDAYTVSLSYQPGPDPKRTEIDVLGQVTPRRGTSLPAESRAALRAGPHPEIVVPVDACGEFRFTALHKTPRRLLLTVGRDQIEMVPLPDLTTFH